MDIVIIGSGNVAAVLGRKFRLAGHHIVQIVSRNAAEASSLAYEWDTESTNYKSIINTTADVYIIAVSDDAIGEIISGVRLPGKVVAHTAASVPMNILKDMTRHYGIFYPLQSLRKDSQTIPEVPIFFEGSDDKSKKTLEVLAQSIAPNKVVQASDETRLKLHVAAVVVSNFTNHLYALAEEYCRKEGIDFKQLYPLIRETAERLSEISPRKAQTGPAVRHDNETIQKHLAMLKDHPRLEKIYQLFSESIQESS
jgi:predicted short-subunit dehydrogenase-like oxidoreductase (DUF2520 family)